MIVYFEFFVVFNDNKNKDSYVQIFYFFLQETTTNSIEAKTKVFSSSITTNITFATDITTSTNFPSGNSNLYGFPIYSRNIFHFIQF